MLELLALALAIVHFGFPLAYYWYAKAKWLRKPWNLRLDEDYRPRVTVILPTYNEAGIITEKLKNLLTQDYQKSLLEIILVDSASTDGTWELIERWTKEHPEFKIRLLKEAVRRGMNPAINFALKHVSEDVEIIIFTDADAFWPKEAIKNIVKYFSDPKIGAVTASILPAEYIEAEASYRYIYNFLRVGESKYHSTPVHNGALVAFRLELIRKIGGLPEYTGNNDSTPASIMAFMGYRAIQIDDITVKEPVRKQFIRKIRRAQHLLLSFAKTKQYVKRIGVYNKSPFDTIWAIEFWLHVVNPWLLMLSSLLFLLSLILYKSIMALAIIVTGVVLFGLRIYRTWITQQVYLLAAAIRNQWTKDLMWSKS